MQPKSRHTPSGWAGSTQVDSSRVPSDAQSHGFGAVYCKCSIQIGRRCHYSDGGRIGVAETGTAWWSLVTQGEFNLRKE